MQRKHIRVDFVKVKICFLIPRNFLIGYISYPTDALHLCLASEHGKISKG